MRPHLKIITHRAQALERTNEGTEPEDFGEQFPCHNKELTHFLHNPAKAKRALRQESIIAVHQQS